MSTFDQMYLSVLEHFKARFKQKAIRIALVYVSLLQIALIFLIGAFFAEFFEQMHINTLSAWKAWTLFGLIAFGLFFKNWMTYTGKKRNILRAKANKRSSSNYKITHLGLLLIGVIGLGILIYRA